MPPLQKKRIFWFEDDPYPLRHYYEELKKEYEIVIGAHSELVEKEREAPFDLLILDLMTHHQSIDYETGIDVQNIRFEGVHWAKTGVEFLKRVRQGNYEKYGFKNDIPAVVATGVANYRIIDEMLSLKIHGPLEKPFTFETLLESMEKALIFQIDPETV